MAAEKEEASELFSPVGQKASRARQGAESFVAAEKILLDITFQELCVSARIRSARAKVTVGKRAPSKKAAQTVAVISDRRNEP